MKKLLLAIVMLFALSGVGFAAVDLNTADQTQLRSVKGIGEKRAKAIIEYRKKNGNFKSVDDLKNVKGFSTKSIAKMKPELTVGGTTAVSSTGTKPTKTNKTESKTTAETKSDKK